MHALPGGKPISDPQTARGSHIIRLQFDVPTAITFSNAANQAAPTQGSWGTDYLYSCEGALILYADQKLHDAIQRACGPAVQGQEVIVTKSKKGRAHVYEVQRCEDEPPDYYEPEPPPPAAAAPRRAQPAPQQPPAQPQPAPYSQTPRPAAQSSEHSRLLHCYTLAIELAAHARRHAEERHGLHLEPNFGDVRAIAATLFINSGEGGGK